MKKAWYLYCNDYNYGQREKGITAIENLQSDSGVELSKDNLIRSIQLGYCEVSNGINQYKAVKRTILI